MNYFDGKLQRGFLLLLSSRAINQIGEGLLGIFIPIFLYTLFEKNIYLLFFYYLLGFLLFGFLVAPGARLINKTGFKNALITGSISVVLFYVTLVFAEKWNVWYFIFSSIATLTLFRILYWVPFHTDFTLFTDHRNRGREVGALTAVLALLGAFGPVIAGYLIAKTGFTILFVITIALHFASVVPLLMLPETKEQFSWSYRETWKHFFSKEKRGALLALGALGAENSIALIVWPIFIFELLQGNVLEVGLVSTVVVITTIVLQLLVGKYLDISKLKKDETLRIGSVFYAVGWIGKIFVVTAFQIFIVGFYHGITKIFTMTPFDTLVYEISADEGHYIDEFTVLREMALTFGRVITLAVVAFLLLFVSLEWTFIIAAGASLLLNAICIVRRKASPFPEMDRGLSSLR
ncbi:MAG TPA: MFS transporter [Candidatus Paceibacterota bacterium]